MIKGVVSSHMKVEVPYPPAQTEEGMAPHVPQITPKVIDLPTYHEMVD